MLVSSKFYTAKPAILHYLNVWTLNLLKNYIGLSGNFLKKVLMLGNVHKFGDNYRLTPTLAGKNSCK